METFFFFQVSCVYLPRKTIAMKEHIINKATEEFIQYGFKSFTMDDLAQKLGMSKKTLYEYYPSKNELVSACIEQVIHNVETNCWTLEGGGNVIENLFYMQKKFIESYKLKNNRPLWELKKYYPKLYEKMEVRLRQIDDKHIEILINKGLKEGLFRKNIDVRFIKCFFYGIIKMKDDPNVYPETDFSYLQIIQKQIEYLIRILSNEKGLNELENILTKINQK